MKRKLRLVFVTTMTIAISTGVVRGTEEQDYKDQMRKGVTVFDFKIGRTASKASKEPASLFVGYGRIPGLGAH
ncbi:MAG TPA: hypothetical protein VEL08_03565 [Chthoniobacterales bacterium]|nr:hypothetical protein [Chthoniobacterales bacterium]